MATFYQDSNNSVVAIMTEGDYKRMLERRALVDETVKKGLPRPQLPPVTPIFTFSSPDHPSFLFMTGSINLMRKLLHGHSVIRSGIWVPFSNGSEWSLNEEEARYERQFRTSLDQAIEAFGLMKSQDSADKVESTIGSRS